MVGSRPHRARPLQSWNGSRLSSPGSTVGTLSCLGFFALQVLLAGKLRYGHPVLRVERLWLRGPEGVRQCVIGEIQMAQCYLATGERGLQELHGSTVGRVRGWFSRMAAAMHQIVPGLARPIQIAQRRGCDSTPLVQHLLAGRCRPRPRVLQLVPLTVYPLRTFREVRQNLVLPQETGELLDRDP